MIKKDKKSKKSNKIVERFKLPLIGSLAYGVQFKILWAVALLFLVLAAFNGYLYIKMAGQINEKEKIANELNATAQKISKTGSLAAKGISSYFKELEVEKDLFNEDFLILQKGGSKNNVLINDTNPKEIVTLLNEINPVWNITRSQINLITKNEKTISIFNKAIISLNELDSKLLMNLKQLQSNVSDESSKKSIGHLMFLQQEVLKNANILYGSDDADLGASFLLGKRYNDFKAEFNSLIPVLESQKINFTELKDLYGKINTLVSFIQKSHMDVFFVKTAFLGLIDSTESISAGASKLKNLYFTSVNETKNYLFIAIALLTAFGFFLIIINKLKREHFQMEIEAAKYSEEQDLQQKSIMQLLNEIGSIAEGDLTVNATTTNSFTSAVAESLNVTIQELRRVIFNVIDTVKKVDNQSDVAAQYSTAMAAAAMDQYDKLALSGDTILNMATRMEDIAKNTTTTVENANKSLNVSKNGITIVENSIEKMNIIRETIQETSKKIKLLGESSTAIGEVTGLIRDITKQINILALNAAIQAASAGEAGRGFAVVAQEVQRLAESSSDAAKRIDDLVLNIQDDAKGAVFAMEQSTKEVVEGAQLTEKAGHALREIGSAVMGVASSIIKITENIESESKNATNISLDVKSLQEFTEKTVADTENTTDAVFSVKSISEEMRQAISNFKV